MSSFTDYPASASNNAKRAIRYKEENGSECGTRVGWTRARQLSEREPISLDTVKRTFSFLSRAETYYDPDGSLDECGNIMYLAWGGLPMKRWCKNLLEKIDETKDDNMTARFQFSAQTNVLEPRVNRDEGTMTGVSLISTGEAEGHDLFVDDVSLQTVMDALHGDPIPAYITHSGAFFRDRLTKEVGLFRNFRIEDGRLLADFEAFQSFKNNDTKRFDTLFELAEKMPERFGLSIVFYAYKVWRTENADLAYNPEEDRPEDAIFQYPSIRVDKVMSADFVDTPAANEKGLFDATEENKWAALSDKLIKKLMDQGIDPDNHSIEFVDLDGVEGNQKNSDEQFLEDQLNQQSDEEESDFVFQLQTEIDALKSEIESLKALTSSFGAAPVQTEESNPVRASFSAKERNEIIDAYAKENGVEPHIAVIKLSRERPELWAQT